MNIYTLYHLLLICTVLVCWPLQSIADTASPLPLNIGNTWQLRSSLGGTPMVFEVVGQSSDAYRVRWENPWIPNWEYHFLPSSNWVLLTALDTGEGVWSLPANTVYFDFNATVNQTWSNAVGTFTLVSKNISVSTPVGIYNNCFHIRWIFDEEVIFDWFLAPGVGFVQFGVGTSAYKLSSPPLLLSSPPLLIVPKGNRILGLDVNTASDDDYQQAIALAKGVGVETVSLTFNWCDIETAPLTYDPTLLTLANYYYPAQGLKVDLFLITMDPVGKCVPADLKNLPINDRRVILRFKRFVDYVFSQMSQTQLNFLVFGSEIDLGLGENQTLWTQYEGFVKAASAYIRAKRPELPVGVSATFNGLIGPFRDQLKRMNPNEIFVSYYPLTDDGGVEPPTVVAGDFNTLVSLYAGQTIYIEQLGYPSSTVVSSSEAQQNAFVKAVFTAWDTYPSVIRSITFSWLTDRSQEQVDAFCSYYDFYDPKFKEMLRTLGLRTYSGQDKAAFLTLQAEAKARRW